MTPLQLFLLYTGDPYLTLAPLIEPGFLNLFVPALFNVSFRVDLFIATTQTLTPNVNPLPRALLYPDM